MMTDGFNGFLNDAQRERLSALSGLFIPYGQAKDALTKLAHLHSVNLALPKKQCTFLVGDTGSGKTGIIEHYQSRFPMIPQEDRRQYRVLIVNVPQGCSLKSMAIAILTAMDDVLTIRGTKETLMNRARLLLKECGVELLIIDETQHLIDKETDRITFQVADFFKDIIDYGICAVVLCGTTDSLRIRDSNPQIERRSINNGEAIFIRPLGFETQEEQTYFRQLLNAFAKPLPFDETPNLIDIDLAQWLYTLSGGYVGKLASLLINATAKAISEDAQRLTRRHIEAAGGMTSPDLNQRFFDVSGDVR